MGAGNAHARVESRDSGSWLQLCRSHIEDSEGVVEKQRSVGSQPTTSRGVPATFPSATRLCNEPSTSPTRSAAYDRALSSTDWSTRDTGQRTLEDVAPLDPDMIKTMFSCEPIHHLGGQEISTDMADPVDDEGLSIIKTWVEHRLLFQLLWILLLWYPVTKRSDEQSDSIVVSDFPNRSMLREESAEIQVSNRSHCWEVVGIPHQEALLCFDIARAPDDCLDPADIADSRTRRQETGVKRVKRVVFRTTKRRNKLSARTADPSLTALSLSRAIDLFHLQCIRIQTLIYTSLPVTATRPEGSRTGYLSFQLSVSSVRPPTAIVIVAACSSLLPGLFLRLHTHTRYTADLIQHLGLQAAILPCHQIHSKLCLTHSYLTTSAHGKMAHISHPLDVDASNMSSRLRNLVQAPKPEIKINIRNPKKVWTTMDEIKGNVSITCPSDTPFDTIEIQLVGTTRTYVERISTAAAVAGRADAFHQFLKLVQPDLEHSYPENRVLLAGKMYDFAFVFNVPGQLLPRVCVHPVHNSGVKQAHLSLPPSFGDKNMDDQHAAQNDMAPDMASIRYGIFARISKSKVTGNEVSRVDLACKARRLRVLPKTEEQAPLAINEDDNEYVMRKTKALRKGVLKGKLGTLTMETAQPSPLRIGVDNDGPQAAPSSATISLRFDPADDSCLPPRLNSISSRLKAITIFASTARQQFPIKTQSFVDASQGAHSSYVNLATLCISNVDWTRQKPAGRTATNLRRDSACSFDPTEVAASSTTDSRTKSFYTASIVVPISLPDSKHVWIPTFHNCLVTRQYTLKLDLGLQGSMGSFLELKAPIQISCDGRASNPTDELPSNAAFDGQDVDDSDDFFEPRMMRAPSEGFVGGRSRIGSHDFTAAAEHDAPPGYTPYVPGFRGGRRAASVPM
nr:hypothetical protein CFP56_54369 [Quercus suber]